MRVITEPDCPDCHGKGEIYDTQENEEGVWMVSYTCPCVRYDPCIDAMTGANAACRATVNQLCLGGEWEQAKRALDATPYAAMREALLQCKQGAEYSDELGEIIDAALASSGPSTTDKEG